MVSLEVAFDVGVRDHDPASHFLVDDFEQDQLFLDIFEVGRIRLIDRFPLLLHLLKRLPDLLA
ncbi:MAG: hypothetical protein JW394_0273 [Nitrospira sp.]|nr:hypothetical protein [Nitrospira sp.]